MSTLRAFAFGAPILIGMSLLAAHAAAAGVAYDYTITHTGGDKDWRVASAVEIDGAQQRVDFREVTGYMAQTAQSDYRSDAFALSSSADLATYYYPAQKQVLERHIEPGAMFKLKQQVDGDTTKGIGTTAEDVRVSVRDLGDGGAIEGMPTRKVEIKLSFVNGVTVGAYKTSGKREYTSTVWSTDRIDPAATAFLAHRLFRDQLPEEANRLIAQRDPYAARFVLRRVTTISVPISGKTVTTTTEEAVTNYRSATFAATEFAAPSGYEAVKHAPVPPR
jgi:hypothetical protein